MKNGAETGTARLFLLGKFGVYHVVARGRVPLLGGLALSPTLPGARGGFFLLLFIHQFRKLMRNGGYSFRRGVYFARIIRLKGFPSFLKGLLKLLFLFIREAVAKFLETFIGPVDKLVKLVSLQNLLAFFLVLLGHFLGFVDH